MSPEEEHAHFFEGPFRYFSGAPAFMEDMVTAVAVVAAGFAHCERCALTAVERARRLPATSALPYYEGWEPEDLAHHHGPEGLAFERRYSDAWACARVFDTDGTHTWM